MIRRTQIGRAGPLRSWLARHVSHLFVQPATTTPSTWASARCGSSTKTGWSRARALAPTATEDMEIVTYVLEGALAHRDSLGTGGVLRPANCSG